MAPRYWTQTLEEFDLYQVIMTPTCTRVTDKTNILIALVYSNKPQNICEVPVIALSDHYHKCVTHS